VKHYVASVFNMKKGTDMKSGLFASEFKSFKAKQCCCKFAVRSLCHFFFVQLGSFFKTL